MPLSVTRAAGQYLARHLAGMGEAVSVALFVGFWLLWAQWVHLSPVITRLSGDFVGFWSAGQLALAGNAAGAYRMESHAAAELALHGDPGWLYVAFFYPPLFLLLCAPLALLAYTQALTVWLGASCAAYVLAVRALVVDRRVWILALGYPAVMANAGYGQNGFLSTALLGGAGLWLDRRPVLAGLCLGCLAYKPQLGVIVPLALAVTGRWAVFAAASLTVLGLALTSLLFGVEVWGAFLANLAQARRWMEIDDPAYLGMWITVYGAIRLHGGPVALAYAAQLAVSLAAAAALLWTLRRPVAGRLTGAAWIAAVAAAIPFCSPFLLEYDLVILAIPMAWLLAEALRGGFHPYERGILCAAYIAPALFKVGWLAASFKLSVIAASAGLLFAVLRRLGREAA